MSKIIVCTGRGGTGKTTFVALAAKYLNSHPLLIDADPDQNLAELLGQDPQKEGVKTISEILFDIQKGKESREFESMSLPDKIEYLLNASCLLETNQFDIISLGVKWTQGCYCMPNNILRSIVPRIAADYRYTIIDSPAGLEHLNRRIISQINDIFVVLDPSKKALNNVNRMRKIASEIGILYENIYLVANHRFGEQKENYIKQMSEDYLGKIEYDPDIEEYSWTGRSLFELPDNSPAFSSVCKFMEKTGYKNNEPKEGG